MFFRYRFNLAIQLGIGAIFYLCALYINTYFIVDYLSIAGAGMIGVAGFLLGGFRIRRPINNICIIVGHPDPDNDRLNHQLANAYQKGAEEKGYTVRRHNLSDLEYDPTLHHGYEKIQELEPDLKKLQEDVVWTDHMVIVYPNWWSSMPAPLKGLFDRIWLPGICFQFHTCGWITQMRSKTACSSLPVSSQPT